MAGIFGVVRCPGFSGVIRNMGTLLRHGESERVAVRAIEDGSRAGDAGGPAAAPDTATGVGVVHLGGVHSEPPIAHDPESGALAVLDGELFENAAFRPGGAKTEAAFLLARFLRDGPDALRDLDGHFSFAVIEADGATTLMTDHFGSRPLYYRELANGGLAFFSEIKGVLALPDHSIRFDPHGIAQIVMLQAPLDETTLLEDVTLVPAGGFVRHRPGAALESGRYWTSPLPEVYEPQTNDEWVDEYVTLLKRSVEARTKKPPLTGVTLSSGYDSRLMISVFPDSVRPLHTFTFGDRRSYDRRNARRIARLVGGRHHEFDLSRDDFLAATDDYNWFTDAMVSCRHGQIAVLFPELPRHVGAVLEGVPAATEVFYMQHFQGFGLYAPIDEQRFTRDHFTRRCKIDPEGASRLLRGPFSEAARSYPGDRYRRAVGEGFPAFAAMRAIDISVWQRLRRFSNMGALFMRTAVEVRQPLYERELYECSLRIPPALYVNGPTAYAKVLARVRPGLNRIPLSSTGLPPDPTLFETYRKWRSNALHDFLGSFAGGRFALYPPKRMFDATGWLRGAFWENMKSMLLSDSLADRGVFDMDDIRVRVADYDEGRPTKKDILWTIYGFELWCRRALDRGGKP